MYTLVRVRPHGQGRYCWTGHIYDVSAGGMRFELDQSLDPGTQIDVRAMLPGAHHITFNATGRIVRLHDDDDVSGPARMGMVFDEFRHGTDEDRLSQYLSDVGLKAA